MGLGSTKKAITDLNFLNVFNGIGTNKELTRLINALDLDELNSGEISEEALNSILNSEAFNNFVSDYNVIGSEKEVIAKVYAIKAKAVLNALEEIDDYAIDNALSEEDAFELKKAILNEDSEYLRKYENDEAIQEIIDALEEVSMDLESKFSEDEQKYFEEMSSFEDPELYKGLEDEENYYNEKETAYSEYENYAVMDVLDFDDEYLEDSFKKSDGSRYDGIILKDKELNFDIDFEGTSSGIDGFYGFTAEQEVRFGWREKGNKYSEDDIINKNTDEKVELKGGIELLFESDSDKAGSANDRAKNTGMVRIGKHERNVTPSMLYDVIVEDAAISGKTTSMGILMDLLAIKTHVLNGVLGKGNPIAAYKCFRSTEALKKNIIQYDYKKINEIKRLTSTEALAKAAIKIYSELEPIDKFTENYNKFTESNPDDRESVELKEEEKNKLIENLKEMKELRSVRGAFYWLRHPINNFNEWRNIKRCEEILTERGVDASAYRPNLSVQTLVNSYNTLYGQENELDDNDRIALEIDDAFEEKDRELNVLMNDAKEKEIDKEQEIVINK